MTDAVVVGSGPNGLAAAVVLARAGVSVLVVEGAATIGGGTRTEALTLPGFVHDVCSAVHPLGASSPLFTTWPLHEHGLEWIEPPLALAHPFDDGPPAHLERCIDTTARSLGVDAERYRALVDPFTRQWPALATDALAPLHWPAHPLLLARFGFYGLRSISRVVGRFAAREARAMLAGIAAHSLRPMSSAGTAALALVLASAGHRAGWPIARGGSRSITDALASYLVKLGGRIETNAPVRSLAELPAARAVLLDVTPREVMHLAGAVLPAHYRRALSRFRYGPGVFKVDWALGAPVPWRSPECATAGTVHLAGLYEDLATSEALVARGEHPERPMVLVAQPSRFDPSRAPAGKHVLWGYCHVPNGSSVDMVGRIEAQVERFAPGFRDLVLARHVLPPAALEAKNPNLVGGDIGDGAYTLRQLFFRPVVRRRPHTTPVRGLYLCSAATPPGGGVHGLCGFYAAQAALRDVFGVATSIASCSADTNPATTTVARADNRWNDDGCAMSTRTGA
ncbi:MAG TPA: NAD(P)/FAD-dependent oxidoreductase [Gemmatimonadaceae bacterium]|nr:NAD(P)/FAD-dependent oxidoreductase [Gemmatimonadaceae bacterium]